ncbi:5349_t:CDS:2 [Ambispora leptoticha]|uniref:Mediator of RNA polymerase II transcription subunit 7 n=1 Tax=Ambispora leptoticha TaxID=144679 RepID=A0A9N9BS14_9GLOM|nr:5349_t:CDS:2 [Ambispora leptoticha]
MTSSIPDPPPFYTRYTDANLKLLEKIKNYKGNKKEALNEFKDELPQDFDITELEPPQPIAEGSYNVFGLTWQVVSVNATLDENIPRLYPEGDFDRQTELKKLNKRLCRKFIALLGSLSAEPFDESKPTAISKDLQDTFMNIKQLLNEYRPHQVDDFFLILLLKVLVNRLTRLGSITGTRCSQLKDLLSMVKHKWSTTDQLKMTMPDNSQLGQFLSTRQQNPPSTSYNLSPATSSHMLQLIDTLQLQSKYDAS